MRFLAGAAGSRSDQSRPAGADLHECGRQRRVCRGGGGNGDGDERGVRHSACARVHAAPAQRRGAPIQARARTTPTFCCSFSCARLPYGETGQMRAPMTPAYATNIIRTHYQPATYRRPKLAFTSPWF
eukprot:6178248-Pleurochrysis_carterae.AAC.4